MTSPSHFKIMVQNGDPAFYSTPPPPPTIWNLRVNIIKILKRDYKQKLVKDIKAIPKKKKQKKKKNMVMKDTKISQNMKNKSWLSIEKNVMK